ncbi:hypothetical protein MtrunA17_Chr8g0353061 [Medicago truncatula]|uniref:Uncharacterized protein n=1 Tax=Medicago truncatula TaxID=3880 RepID=A0A396GJB0_MEDTR|nr:hypothetical protein MtrunA17_Chr8g0353061 [Medicago truncatula]
MFIFEQIKKNPYSTNILKIIYKFHIYNHKIKPINFSLSPYYCCCFDKKRSQQGNGRRSRNPKIVTRVGL